MSREIKFRAWLKEEKKIVNIETMHFTEKWIGYHIFYEEEKKKKFEFSDSENFELMQYTGLEDKNGIEIYEGDILKYKFPYDRRLKHVSLVKFIETEASFGLKDIYGNEIPLYRITANNYFEVVGNIYENPELLNLLEGNNG